MRENVLTLLPARARQVIYIAYGVAVIGAGAVDAVYSHVDPTWLLAVSRVLEFLAIPVAALAATHVTPNSPTAAAVPDGPADKQAATPDEVNAPEPNETVDPADTTSGAPDQPVADLPEGGA